MLQEREQLVAQGLPENIQLSGLNIAEVIRGQGEVSCNDVTTLECTNHVLRKSMN